MYFFLHQKNAASGSSDLSRNVCTCKLHEIDCISTHEHSPADNSSIQNALENLREEREFFRFELVLDGQTVEIYPIRSKDLYLFSDTNGLNVTDSQKETAAVATLHADHPGVSVSVFSSASIQVNGVPLADKLILKDGDTLTFSENADQRLIFHEPDWLAEMSAETRRLYVELLNSPGKFGHTIDQEIALSLTFPVEHDPAQTSTNVVATATPSIWFTLSLLILTALISASGVYLTLYLLSI